MNKRVKLLAIFLLFLPFTHLLLAQTEEVSETVSELTNISFEKTDNQLDVFIEFKGNILYESFTLIDPNRLIIDLTPIDKISAKSIIEINDVGITRIRINEFKPGIVRVVFDFTTDIIQYKIEESEKGLMIQFSEEKVEEIKEPVEVEKPEKELEHAEKIQEEKLEQEKPSTPPVQIIEAIEEKKEEVEKLSIALSSGYYFFLDKIFQDIYGKETIFVRAEYSFLFPINIKSLDVWTSMSYFKKSGKLTLTLEDVDLSIITSSIAIRYLREISRFTPFIGVGMDYIVYKERYPEDFIISSTGGWDVGFRVQTGTYFSITPSLSSKILVKYNYSKTKENDVDVNLSGIECGIGLIFHFNI